MINATSGDDVFLTSAGQLRSCVCCRRSLALLRATAALHAYHGGDASSVARFLRRKGIPDMTGAMLSRLLPEMDWDVRYPRAWRMHHYRQKKFWLATPQLASHMPVHFDMRVCRGRAQSEPPARWALGHIEPAALGYSHVAPNPPLRVLVDTAVSGRDRGRVYRQVYPRQPGSESSDSC